MACSTICRIERASPWSRVVSPGKNQEKQLWDCWPAAARDRRSQSRVGRRAETSRYRDRIPRHSGCIRAAPRPAANCTADSRAHRPTCVNCRGWNQTPSVRGVGWLLRTRPAAERLLCCELSPTAFELSSKLLKASHGFAKVAHQGPTLHCSKTLLHRHMVPP